MTVSKYRKRPIVIEAIKWTGANIDEIESFAGYNNIIFALGVCSEDGVSELYIKTLEGNHKAIIGDFIIKGIAGEFYPCKSDIFLKTYERV